MNRSATLLATLILVGCAGSAVEPTDERAGVPAPKECTDCLTVLAPGVLPSMPQWQFRPRTGYPPAVSSSGSLTGLSGLHVSIVDSDQRLWYIRYVDSKWSAWENLGGVNTTAPAMDPNAQDARMYVRGSNDQVWTRERTSYGSTGTWKAWYSLGGVHRSAAGVKVFRGTSRDGSFGLKYVHLFAVGSDNALWQNDYEYDCDCWDSWRSLSQPAQGFKVDAASTVAGNGQDRYFARAANDRLMWSFQPKEWSDAGIQVTSGPAFVTFYDLPVSDVFESFLTEIVLVKGTDNRLWYNLHSASGAWKGWTPIESDFPFSSGPAATLYYHHPTKGWEIAVFAFDDGLRLRKRAFYLKTGTWSSSWETLGSPQ